MKKELFRSLKGKMLIDQSYISYLFNNHIKILRSKNKVVLFFYSEKSYYDLLDEFNLIPSCICIIKRHIKEGVFLSIQKKTSAESIMDNGLNMKKGFLGKGIYCIEENHFIKEDEIYHSYLNKAITKYEYEYELFNYILFSYTGVYLECLSGDNKDGIISLQTPFIQKESIYAVLEEEMKLIEKSQLL